MKNNKRYYYILVAVVIVVAVSVGLWRAVKGQEGGFFFQTENYIAAPVASTLKVALTGLGNDGDISTFQKAVSMSFEGNDAVKITDFRVEKREAIADYSACSVTVTLSFDEVGVTEATALRLCFPDGGERSYQIGTWTFDVQDELDHQELMDVWSSPAASMVGSAFPYNYELLEKTASVQSIQYGVDLLAYVTDGGVNVEGDKVEGTLNLPGETPVKLIRPRITVEWSGETYSVYGICCYCGALNVTEDDIQAARDAAA